MNHLAKSTKYIQSTILQKLQPPNTMHLFFNKEKHSIIIRNIKKSAVTKNYINKRL